MYSPFHFSKIYLDITSISNMHFSIESGLWEPGREFTYADLLTEKKQKMFGLDF